MRAAFVLALALAGCGGTPADTGAVDMAPFRPFVGTWVGTLILAAQPCSDGSTAAASSGPATLPIVQSPLGDVSWHANCGVDVVANLLVSGVEAVQQGTITCPPSTKNGLTTTVAFSAIDLKVNGNALSVAFTQGESFTGSQTGSCSGGVSGTLARQ